MTNYSQSDTANDSTTQRLPVEKRRDLIVSQTGSKSFPLWTIKDPVAEKFYQLRQQDFFVFAHLDGHSSIAEIQNSFYQNHAPQRLSSEQILSFVQRLFAQGLVQLNRYGTSNAIKSRADRIQQSERKQKLSSLLAIRFRGIDPDRWLTASLPYIRWCFSPLIFAVSLVLLMFAGSIVFAEWEQIYRDLPSFGTFLKSGQLFWFMATIGVIKILHELAHAFACKYCGGECHELGVMLLAFTPCLYCNVSDAWLMRNRWHRIAISSAGIYLEVIIASISTLIWYWTVPGMIHTISLYLMVISSVSTVFLNGNPLLRYDGYYILSDLVEIPNLRGRSQALVRTWWMKLFFDIRSADPLRGQSASKLLLGLYGIFSGLYIWFVVFAIIWMLYQFAKPYGLQPVVVALGVFIVSSKVAGVGQSIIGTVVSLERQNRLRKLRFSCAAIIVSVCVVCFFMLEFPRRIQSPCIIEPGESSTVFVSSPGQVEFVNLEAGSHIDKDAELARLKNRELEREVLKLEGRFKQQQKHIELLLQRQSRDASVAQQIPSAQSALLSYQEQLKDKQEDLKRLTLLAPRSGVILPVEDLKLNSVQTKEFNMNGDVIAARNEGAWLEAGMKLCVIADAKSVDAVVYVDQAEAVLLKAGQEVRVVTHDQPGQKVVGEIIEISSIPLTTIPPALLRLELIPYEPDGEGRLKPARPIHEVRVRLQSNSKKIPFGQTGVAVIHFASESIYSSLLRMLRESVTFEL